MDIFEFQNAAPSTAATLLQLAGAKEIQFTTCRKEMSLIACDASAGSAGRIKKEMAQRKMVEAWRPTGCAHTGSPVKHRSPPPTQGDPKDEISKPSRSQADQDVAVVEEGN